MVVTQRLTQFEGGRIAEKRAGLLELVGELFLGCGRSARWTALNFDAGKKRPRGGEAQKSGRQPRGLHSPRWDEQGRILTLRGGPWRDKTVMALFFAAARKRAASLFQIGTGGH